MIEAWNGAFFIRVIACIIGLMFGAFSAFGLGKTIDKLRPNSVWAVILLLIWFTGTIAASTRIARWLL